LWTKASFKSANPPATPALLSPANNALNTNYVPLLKWGASTLPTGTTFRHYRLQVATDNGFKDLAFEKLIDSRTTPFYQVWQTMRCSPTPGTSGGCRPRTRSTRPAPGRQCAPSARRCCLPH
jgi:hypothetical protein